MTRLSVFNSPLLLGFEHFERTVDRVTKSVGDGYPPYNIEQIGPDRLRITVAVAGFGVADLSITVEDNQLIIRGKQADEGAERVFIHRGIAARQFQRAFVLAEGSRSRARASITASLRSIWYAPRPVARVRNIEIASSKSKRPKRRSWRWTRAPATRQIPAQEEARHDAHVPHQRDIAGSAGHLGAPISPTSSRSCGRGRRCMPCSPPTAPGSPSWRAAGPHSRSPSRTISIPSASTRLGENRRSGRGYPARRRRAAP